MTAPTVDFAPAARSQELRSRVRDRLEERYLRLRDLDRPALMEQFDAHDVGTDDAKVGRAIALMGYQIAAIAHHLQVVHDPHPDDSVCPDCCVLVDAGAGPEWLLLAALSEGDLPVIANDSALGRALIGARPGQDVDYPTPCGPRTVRVLAMEPSV